MASKNPTAPAVTKVKKKSALRKLLGRKLFWAALIILVIGGWFGYSFFTQKPQTAYTTEDVKLGTLSQTVSATGKVESADDISLNFQNPGKVVELNVKEGDKVKAGDILARIDSSSANSIVQQYRANVTAARADLARIKAGASSQDVDISQQQLIKAQDDLNNLRTDATNQLNALLLKDLDTMKSSISVGQLALNRVYNDLINTETTVNIAYNNSGLQERVTLNYGSLTSELNQAIAAYNDASSQKSNETVVAAANNLRSVLIKINSLLDDAFDLAESIIVKTSYPQASKDAVKTDIATQQTSINSYISSLQTANSGLVNGSNSYASQIKTAESNVTITQSQLNLKTAAPRYFEIQSAQAKVDLAVAQLNKALSDLKDYVLISPINGTVTKVNSKLGEQATVSQPVIQMLSTEKYQVKVDIPESDVAKINVGNKVFIKLDAFGSDHIFNGTITFIDPAQTVIQDVVYYKTTASFDTDEWNNKVKPGMTADVTIKTAQKDDVLYIPQRAVKIKETTLGQPEEKYVEVLVNGANGPQVAQKTVTIGLRGDNGLVEIVSGLEQGEKVITFKKQPGTK